MSKVDGLAIKRVRIDTLHEDPANVRKHGQKNMAAIRASLQEFGQVEPLVVQAGSGKVIGGNGRLAAMRALKWEECEIVEIAVDDTQAARIGIALNRTGELAEWDTESLTELLSTLNDADALGGVGFDAKDLAAMLGEGSSAGGGGAQVGAVEFRVVVEKLDEASQAALLARLDAEGYSCRALMS